MVITANRKIHKNENNSVKSTDIELSFGVVTAETHLQDIFQGLSVAQDLTDKPACLLTNYLIYFTVV